MRIGSGSVRGVIALGAFMVFSAFGALAAEVAPVSSGPGSGDLSMLSDASKLACTHRLSGPIARGDVARVEQALGSHSGIAVMCLDSPGGSFAEGIALATLFRARGVITLVEDRRQCLSACAVAFLGGSYEMLDTTTYRAIQPGARLGFHAPAIELPDGTYSADVVEGTYGAALEHINLAIRDLGLPQPDTGAVLLPNSLLVEMLTTPPDRIRLVETVNDAALWNIEVAARLAVTDARAFAAQACFNGFHWAAGRAAPAATADDLGQLQVEAGEGGAYRFVSRPGTDVEALCDINPGFLTALNIVGMQSAYFAFASLVHGLPGPTKLVDLK